MCDLFGYLLYYLYFCIEFQKKVFPFVKHIFPNFSILRSKLINESLYIICTRKKN